MSHPTGVCECGCGQKTSLAPQSHSRQGWVKGQPLRFVVGHGNRRHPHGRDIVDTGFVTPCWLWRGATTSLGYAKRGTVNVFREMWEADNGPVPAGLELDHLCRQTSCVRPSHLEAVTHAENIRRSTSAKLTSRDVVEIRADLRRTGIVAKDYGVSGHTIWSIRAGRTWRAA